MKRNAIDAVLIMIGVTFAVFLVFLMAKDTVDAITKETEERKILNGEVVLTEFNGTTSYLIYRVEGKYYLLKKSGYGKPEQSIWKEEDDENENFLDRKSV